MKHTAFPRLAEATCKPVGPLIPSRDAVVAWTPRWHPDATGFIKGTEGLVEVRPYGPAGHPWTEAYSRAGGAAIRSWGTATPLRRRLWLSNLFIELVIIDQVDLAIAAHAFRQISEFSDWLPSADINQGQPDPCAPSDAPRASAVWLRHGGPP